MEQKDHEKLSRDFNACAFEIIKKESDIKALVACLSDNTLLLTRIFYNKLYYALYHFVLATDQDIFSRTGPGLHEAIRKKLQADRSNADLFLIFSKMQDLRVWADYKSDSEFSPALKNLTMNNLCRDAYVHIKKITAQ